MACLQSQVGPAVTGFVLGYLFGLIAASVIWLPSYRSLKKDYERVAEESTHYFNLWLQAMRSIRP